MTLFCINFHKNLIDFVSGADVLAQIILEAVALLENSGIFVDCIVSDGAQWNRGMWKQFGVHENNPFCEHVADDGRRLYFVSDFPHLIKNLWTWIVDQKEIEVCHLLGHFSIFVNLDQYLHFFIELYRLQMVKLG